MNPYALTTPASDPIMMAAAGDASRSQLVPIATPPASVAFSTTSMSSELIMYLE